MLYFSPSLALLFSFLFLFELSQQYFNNRFVNKVPHAQIDALFHVDGTTMARWHKRKLLIRLILVIFQEAVFFIHLTVHLSQNFHSTDLIPDVSLYILFVERFMLSVIFNLISWYILEYWGSVLWWMLTEIYYLTIHIPYKISRWVLTTLIIKVNFQTVYSNKSACI